MLSLPFVWADVAAVAAVYVAGVLTLFSNNLLHELSADVCVSAICRRGRGSGKVTGRGRLNRGIRVA